MTADFFVKQKFHTADISLMRDQNKFAFTVDVEEWFQVGAFETTFDKSNWSGLESRVETQTSAVLDLLHRLEIKGTFFALGSVAERYPNIIQAISAAGHEIACHGMDHGRIFTMSRPEFRADIRRAKDLLESATNCSVIGYRAPSFSLTPDVWWAYEELADAGFKYSSSLYPVKTDHYGARSAPRRPFYPIPDNGFVEIPMTVCDFPLLRMPASGGGYFRLLPYFLSEYMIARGARQAQSPAILYMHPWEMDLGQPHVKNAPLLSRFRHYTGQKALPKKLHKISRAFAWGCMKDIFATIIQPNRSAK